MEGRKGIVNDLKSKLKIKIENSNKLISKVWKNIWRLKKSARTKIKVNIRL